MQETQRINDYTNFLSRRSARRQPSAIRELMPLMRIEGMISLGGGLPNQTTFPFEKINVALKDGTSLEISGERLAESLNYSPSYGLPGLVNWIRNHQQRVHNPPYGKKDSSSWNVCVCTGSQDALAIAFDMLINEGDTVLTEIPTYSGSLAALNALGSVLVGVETDNEGLIPLALENTLKNWDISKHPFPRVLYTIPTGQNPSGSTLSSHRKQQIYSIACNYNLIILEDDPYYFLTFSSNDSADGAENMTSFLSLDVQGRVLRFDSFSKVLSSGLRLGWVTGPSPLVERMQLHQQASCLHPSGVSQGLALALLEKWGIEGWTSHLHFVQNFYKQRRDSFLEAAKRHLEGLAEWSVPHAGMFVWFKLLGIKDSRVLIKEKAVNKKVLLVPGVSFIPNPTTPSNYVRASYSTASLPEMDEALRRLASLLKEERVVN
eukprot:TRINITY_DN996_c0_g1_i1.p1 TRINITY_DN996_c0_g1~~TRINITY_DN996_c0_g1_i1.p1  ORF type:complete len:501 (-),score=122.09 TRINITY_DN996_c0_g1_i1:88-1389(-)